MSSSCIPNKVYFLPTKLFIHHKPWNKIILLSDTKYIAEISLAFFHDFRHKNWLTEEIANLANKISVMGIDSAQTLITSLSSRIQNISISQNTEKSKVSQAMWQNLTDGNFMDRILPTNFTESYDVLL